jgi:hypothetical protein
MKTVDILPLMSLFIMNELKLCNDINEFIQKTNFFSSFLDIYDTGKLKRFAFYVYQLQSNLVNCKHFLQ